MLRDLAPSEIGPAIELIEDPTEEQGAAFYAAARAQGSLSRSSKEPEATEEDEDAQQPMNFSLLDAIETAEKKTAPVLVFALSPGSSSAFR